MCAFKKLDLEINAKPEKRKERRKKKTNRREQKNICFVGKFLDVF
jgi:hypothetical protein